MVGLSISDPLEYQRQYRLKNRDKLLANRREIYLANRDKMRAQRRKYYSDNHDNRDGYWNGELDPNSATGRGFVAERIVAKSLGLNDDAQCNCTAKFHFAYDLLDTGGYGEINVKSSRLSARKSSAVTYWQYNLRNKYVPDTYIFVAYTEDYKDIKHVWIIPACVGIVSDKKGLGISNSEKGLSRVQEFEVDNTMYNVYLHTMSIDNCSVLKKQDFVEEMLECL